MKLALNIKIQKIIHSTWLPYFIIPSSHFLSATENNNAKQKYQNRMSGCELSSNFYSLEEIIDNYNVTYKKHVPFILKC